MLEPLLTSLNTSPALTTSSRYCSPTPHLLSFCSAASLQRQVLSALSQISKHSLELAEMVVEADIFPAVLVELKGKTLLSLSALSHSLNSADPDDYVRKNAATLTREVVRHTQEVSATVSEFPPLPPLTAGTAGGELWRALCCGGVHWRQQWQCHSPSHHDSGVGLALSLPSPAGFTAICRYVGAHSEGLGMAVIASKVSSYFTYTYSSSSS